MTINVVDDQFSEVRSVVCLVRDDLGQLLLATSRDAGPWSLLGGVVKNDERVLVAAARYPLEDCGVIVEVGAHIAELSGDAYRILYECGERQAFRADVFSAIEVGRAKDAPMTTKWFAPSDLHDLYVDDFAVAALSDLGLR